MKIILATQNKRKLDEFIELSKNSNYPINFVIKPLKEDIGEIEENGNSYFENALIKANAVFNYYKEPVLSDDSGLELPEFKEILGIYSSRFAGINATDKENRYKLLDYLKSKNITETSAKYVCVLVYIFNQGEALSFKGEWEGKIIVSDNLNLDTGFGYDPMFVPKEYTITVSEMSISEKNLISHRAKAVNQFLNFLKDKK
ncbi:RdgB/HAM1 family non-canonical purine NTP pyrophosphatase [Malacoplasma penetrans]|uniref:dITP/XTP pyrophosphatase n=1 Tax=Malacoplasma penetrans (strain HF-2) TaxID=272633 RepID=IXTPA_MALP2|nr:RdgB/HAM1 family non-canonical purine NTP pyrophosphatase [Malacoplasma penetrans]Q8EVN6.1 RecName: Full=dITP/XTP pyrophosphatase; AltName: Full=Non-canonical purine NTP pyrophosphatase; AltName: Full=Non-standard purine NTP pyrophosphatase; AltName: Full=Nucleoside-triphosphate diphosphatase; AltName: Full=Nucleoside-triphosphate pyrophosphatase; Short=NTPase [Malacoplasma penetrans HF-2]RXY96516.1 RdgB/HAM1 family non-canonical purine NTP pyrophosphatase [Malacoplasma penetrans]BAC44314.1 p